MSIRILVQFALDPADVEEFERFVTDATAGVREKDGRATLDYDYFVADDAGLQCIVHEHYVDVDALFSHIRNLGELLPVVQRLMKVERVIMIGDLSADVVEQLKAFSGEATFHYGRRLSELNTIEHAPT